MIRLAVDVDGHRVLGSGCGSALRAKGASVAAFDRRPAMIELARQTLGRTRVWTSPTSASLSPSPMHHFDDGHVGPT